MSYVTVWVWVSRIRQQSYFGHTALAIVPTAESPLEGYVSFGPAKSGSPYGPGKGGRQSETQLAECSR